MILWISYEFNHYDETVCKTASYKQTTATSHGCDYQPEAVTELTFSSSFCMKSPFYQSYLPSECPLSLCVAWGLCVCLNEYYFYSVIIYCSGELMLAAQVINQLVMRLKVQLKTGCCSCGPHPVQDPIKLFIRKNIVDSCYHMAILLFSLSNTRFTASEMKSRT